MGSLYAKLPSNSPMRYVLATIVIAALLVALWLVRGILMLALASIIIVILLDMPIYYLVRRGLNRGLATLISLIIVVLSVSVLFSLMLPTLVTQFTTLATVTVPQGIERLIDQWNNGDLQRQFPFLESVNPEELLNTLSVQLAGAIGQFGVTVLPVLGGVADTIISILITIFLSMYLLADPDMHREAMIRLFPMSYRLRVREILGRLSVMLRGWLKATIISMGFVAVATWLGMALLGIQQAVALGVLAGLLSFVPNFGPVIALVPSIAVGIVQAPNSLLWIVLVIYGVSFIQSQIVTPLLVAGSIKVPPVLVLLGQIIAGVFLGFLGLMLAVPLTAGLMVLVQEVYIKDILGDRGSSTTPVQPITEEFVLPEGL